MTGFQPAVFLVLLLSGGAHLSAELKFESRIARSEQLIGEGVIKSTFHFTNTGPQAIKVSRIRSSCGCLKAVADRVSYAPGETGTIETEFNVPANSGEQRKSITVETDQSQNSSIELAVNVRVLPLLVIEPKMTAWAVGETPAPKKISIVVQTKDPIRILSVTPSKPEFSAQLRSVEEGRRYEIELRPSEINKPMMSVLRIETDCVIANQKVHLAFARIAATKKVAGSLE